MIPRLIPQFCSFMAAFLYFAVAVPAGAVPSIAAKQIPEAVVLDGILNEPVWTGGSRDLWFYAAGAQSR